MTDQPNDPAQPPPSRFEWPPETEPDVTYRFTYKSGPAHIELHTDPPPPAPEPAPGYAQATYPVPWGEPVTHEARVYAVEPPPVLTALEELIDAPPITAPQAQGDVIILPWPPDTAAAWRSQEIGASVALPTAGVAVTPDGSHTAATDTLTPRARWTERRKGNALGTLVVPPGAVARLAHREHPDLHIGPGVYILQTQRRWQAPAAD